MMKQTNVNHKTDNGNRVEKEVVFLAVPLSA